MHPLALTDTVRTLTARVQARRFTLQNERMNMARLIEIKGLGDAVASAKKGISDLKTSASNLSSSTGKLIAEINDLTAQVEQHREDLRFEAETLGNGNGGVSDRQSEKPAVQPPQAQQTAIDTLAQVAPPDVVHVFEIELKQPEPQTTPQDPARAMAR